MKNTLKVNHGLTLVEVMISVMITIVLLTAAATTMINSRLLCSVAKHKSQAALAAQQILEQKRRTPFPSIASASAVPVTLDTKGTYNTTADDFNGTATITVTTIDTYRKKVQVEIDWFERLSTGGRLTMKEYFATTIANEPQLN